MRGYELLDSGDNRKLEQVGDFRLIRPSPAVIWPPSLPQSEWQNFDGVYKRDSGGGGKWSFSREPLPESWIIERGSLRLMIKPTDFGHLGFFAEQLDNWSWLRQTVASIPVKPSVLNLFAYSGGSTLAMALENADVTHVDASKGMIAWGQENLRLNEGISGNVRWIVDDVMKFVKREIRRGKTYNGVVLDPPTFGRGSRGEVWKIEKHLVELLTYVSQLIARASPFFVLLTGHSPGFTPIITKRLLAQMFSVEYRNIEAGEMIISERNERQLPAGVFARLKT